MNNISILNQTEITMTSREIADLVGSRHDKVKQSIERLSSKKDSNGNPTPLIDVPPMGEYLDQLGRPATQYIFSGQKGKRDSYVVVAQLSPEFTARLVDRWQELEAQAVGKEKFHIPATLSEALQLAADQARIIEEQRPKVEVYEKLAERKGDVSTTILAKQLGTSAIKLNQWLRDKGMKWKNADLPMAGYMDWFNTIADVKNGHEFSQCLITPLGQIEIAKRFTKP